ncbi:MAG: hypothetical protein Q7L55_09185 [Actinomycetota bacterium]|nr:hypothetical protein [Actinomycetota bacterium]
MKFNDNPTIKDAWWDELERFEYDDSDFDTAACAELADELELFRVQAFTDPNFLESFAEWEEYIWDKRLWLALEQCCHEGVLLPMGQRELRVKSCPEELLVSLRHFFGHCPTHVKHHLALQYWLVMRMERARRTGSPDWRPETAKPCSPTKDTVFFQPPKLTVRKYTG